MLIREALTGHSRDNLQISVKFGALRDPARQWSGYDSRPAAVKNFLAYSLQRLGADHIDIYRPARLDPNVPIEETIGAIADMIKAGYVRHIGLSEVGSDTIRRAHKVHPIADLQIEYSLIARGIESDILKTCRELGHRHHRLWRIGARPDQRTLVEGSRRGTGFPNHEPAVSGQQSGHQPGAGGFPCAQSPRKSARHRPRLRSPG